MFPGKQAILDELGGIDESVYDGLVADFAEQTKIQLHQVREHAARGKLKDVADLLHSIKGCAANLRLEPAFKAACEAEDCFKSHSPGTETSARLSILENCIKELH